MFRTVLLKLHGDRRGVTALEYGLIAALIAVVIIGSVNTIGGDLRTIFDRVAGHVTSGTIK